jgi:superfamily II DNA or RNA helicase
MLIRSPDAQSDRVVPVPRIFDNISEPLYIALTQTLPNARRADFCVGYFNLRGWKLIANEVEALPADAQHPPCRLLIGMHRPPQEQIRQLFAFGQREDEIQIDSAQTARLKRLIVAEYRDQLMLGAPTSEDEAGLRQLARQIRARRVQVKLFLRYPLHAKLYLLHQPDNYSAPIHAYLGSSNLTLAGLKHQGELNTEVTDGDAAQKLARWFNDRWTDTRCLDISEELARLIDESWAGETLRSPYEVYVKMAYHLAEEAIAGMSGEFKLPKEFRDLLFEYQVAAVQIAANHVNRRGGVLLGDVVGLGKTLMATAIARIFQDDMNYDTLILCPPALVPMWQRYVDDYRLIAKIIPTSMASRDLPELRRYRLVIIDESHNLRNRDGQRYAAVQEYLLRNECRVVLLSATPYNKTYLDLSSQMRLFIPEDHDLGIRPERLMQETGEAQFISRYQTGPRTLAAFEKSEHIDDWRDLMRLYLVRRTRSFILNNYAETDAETGRQYLRMHGGGRNYFPLRVPRTVRFHPNAQYSRLHSDEVVGAISGLHLPRYGLGQYVSPAAAHSASPDEAKQLENLKSAGQRLIGFSRTNLFKRLESSGMAFLQSIDRHILRNNVYLYAIEHGLDLPIGTQDAAPFDPGLSDGDIESEDGDAAQAPSPEARARQVYEAFRSRKGFKWLSSRFFLPDLARHLRQDSASLQAILDAAGRWDPADDVKLNELHALLTTQHPTDKVLIFSQFADTVTYLRDQLQARGVAQLEAATGQSANVTDLAVRFSPRSNGESSVANEIRVLLSTDVLSEGQNLQDAAIVVNYDLPWAIIRLSQRVGRVDRIGQQAERILAYSFLPAEGIEQIIRLRARVRLRLNQNSEVVGSDEEFFDDQDLAGQLNDLYTEKSGILDAEVDSEIDLASYAFQIWTNACKADPALAKRVQDMPNTVVATRHYTGSEGRPQGVLAYLKTADGADSLAWLDETGAIVTQSQYAILRAAECPPGTPGTEHHPAHHKLVENAVDLMLRDDYNPGGQLGKANSPRRKAYDRLNAHVKQLEKEAPLFATDELKHVIDMLYRWPLRQSAREAIGRQIRAGLSDEDLARRVLELHRDDRLSITDEDGEAGQNTPRILCSLGLFTDVG